MNTQILSQLRQPFSASVIYWKPGSMNKERTKAMAMPYANLRAYQNRLDEVCGFNWSVSYTPWGDKIICHLTIDGVTRSATGEPSEQSERSEIAGTAAEAQAFKRACAMFALGRYLYSLPTPWLDYDGNTKQFTEKAKAKLAEIVAQYHRRQAESATVQPELPPEQPEGSDMPTDGTDKPEAAIEREALQSFEAQGKTTFGHDWPTARTWLTERYTTTATASNVRTDPATLSDEELKAIVSALTTNGRHYRKEWFKYRDQLDAPKHRH